MARSDESEVEMSGEFAEARRARLERHTSGRRRRTVRRLRRRRRGVLATSLVFISLGFAAAQSGGALAVNAATAGVPALASSYNGTIHNTTYGLTANLALTGITESSLGIISGVMTVEPPLYGSGPFTGTVSGSSISIAVESTTPNLCPGECRSGVFTGTLGPQGILNGSYIVYKASDVPENGTWEARPGPSPEVFGFRGIARAPSNKQCVSRRSFTIHIRKLASLTYRQVTVYVNRRRVDVRRGRRMSAPVNLRGLPKGLYTVKITVATITGQQFTGTRRYHACSPKRLSVRGNSQR